MYNSGALIFSAPSDLRKIVDYTGFMDYGSITSPGVWIFEERPDVTGSFVKVK